MSSFFKNNLSGLCAMGLFLLFTIFPTALYSEDLSGLRKIISEELVYPRECKYLLPAVLPATNKNAAENEEYERVSKVLEKMDVIKLVPFGKSTKIVPAKNTYDILKQNVDMSYELISINIVLGTWDVELKQQHKDSEGITVKGFREIKNKTKLYKPVTEVLSKNNVRLYIPAEVQWRITNKNKEYKVSERIL
ncbi:MAG: hypothetical protein HQK92_16300 [Nitrospirae bacterium]|nr:hypothetical protein [Nitrospirota bacterium]